VEELSCERQRPVVSDGRRFENEEMGLSAVFPAGSRVCLARSGDAARGFYALYGGVPGCRAEDFGAAMSLSSSFNSLFYRTAEEAAPDYCGGVGSDLQEAAGGPFTFPGHRSIACEELDHRGPITITVYALAGEPARGVPARAPAVIYFASIITRPGRAPADLRMFRAFLATAHIGTLARDADTVNWSPSRQ
jgi:hypothetical protein